MTAPKYYPDIRAGTRRGKPVLVGKLISTETGETLTKQRSMSYTPDTREIVRGQLINILNDEYRAASVPNDLSESAAADEIRSAFESACAELSTYHAWSTTTRSNTIRYFKKHILPLVMQRNAALTRADIDERERSLLEKAKVSPNYSGNAAIAQNSVRKQLYRAGILYDRMRQFAEFLPDVTFALNGQGVAIRPERCKALPDEARVKLFHALLALIKTPKGGLALGLLLMFFCGLRPAEAAGLHFDRIAERDSYAVAQINAQEKDGKLSYELKTPSAHRPAVFSYTMLCAYRLRVEYVQSKLDDPEEYRSLLCVCSEKDITCMAASDAVSALGLDLIEKCVDKEFIKAMKAEMEADIGSGELEAYILRRDFITRCSNICGMSQRRLDFLVGHENSDTAYRDYISEDELARTAEILERYVVDPELSLNPAFHPIMLPESGEVERGGYANMVFKASSRVRVRMRIETTEPYDTLTVASPTATISSSLYTRTDRIEDRANRLITGALHDAEYYAQLKQLGAKIKPSRKRKTTSKEETNNAKGKPRLH